jgi:AcrR family transcriptional regulator
VARRTQQDRKIETRRRLLRSAARLFARHGVDAVSVDAVAAAADRTSGAVYAHFGSKQGLLTSLLEGWRADTAAVIVAQQQTAAGDPRSRLAALWDNLVDPPHEDGALWLLLEHEMWLRAMRDPQIGARLAERYEQVRRDMATSIDEWLEQPGDSAARPAAGATATAGRSTASATAAVTASAGEGVPSGEAGWAGEGAYLGAAGWAGEVDSGAEGSQRGGNGSEDAGAEWVESDGERPAARDLAVLVIALLVGLDMQRRLDPDAVPDDLAYAGLARLHGIRLPAPVRPA